MKYQRLDRHICAGRHNWGGGGLKSFNIRTTLSIIKVKKYESKPQSIYINKQ